jgi:hypothetical protein
MRDRRSQPDVLNGGRSHVSRTRIIVAAAAVTTMLVAAVGVYASAKIGAPSGRNPIVKVASSSGAQAAYIAAASAPLAPAAIRSSEVVAAMTAASGVSPSTLRAVAGNAQGSLVVGINASGQTCVGLADTMSAGSFTCDPLRVTPVYVLAVSAGNGNGPKASGVIGLASTAVSSLKLVTADGQIHQIAVASTAGFSYYTSDPAAYGAKLEAYDSAGQLLLDQPLPSPGR